MGSVKKRQPNEISLNYILVPFNLPNAVYCYLSTVISDKPKFEVETWSLNPTESYIIHFTLYIALHTIHYTNTVHYVRDASAVLLADSCALGVRRLHYHICTGQAQRHTII